MSPFQQAKLDLVTMTGLAKDALHIYVGLIIFFGSCLLFGWKARQWKPVLLVLLVALAGEAWDLRDALVYGSAIDLAGSAKDIMDTVLAPAVLLLAARFSGIFRGR
jgi:hypothetical protein